MYGALRKGEITALMAAAKVGKSSLLAQIIYHLVEEIGVPVAYASLEMDPKREVLPNLASIHYKRLAEKVPPTTEEEPEWLDKISSWPLCFTPSTGPMPSDDFLAWIKAAHDNGVEYFFWDHLQYTLMEAENFAEASRLMQRVTALVKELDVCLWMILQPKQLPRDVKEITKHDARGGAALVQAIDNLLVLGRYREHGEIVDGYSVLRVADVRSKMAKTGTLYLQYDPSTTRFTEVKPAEVKTSAPAVYQHPAPMTLAEQLVRAKL